jgi:hypothetical protein
MTQVMENRELSGEDIAKRMAPRLFAIPPF